MERAKERERDWMGGKGRKKVKVRMINESKPNEDTRKASDTNRETTTTKE